MSKAVSFAKDIFGSPEADPLNQTDLSSPRQAPASSPERPKERQRGLDSVFAASSSLSSGSAAIGQQQKAVLVVRTSQATVGLDQLNRALGNGWELLHVTLVGDSEKNAPWLAGAQSDAYFSALVFIEQNRK